MNEFKVVLIFEMLEYLKEPPPSEPIPEKVRALHWAKGTSSPQHFPKDGDTFYYYDGKARSQSNSPIANFCWRDSNMQTMYQKHLSPKENHVLYLPQNSMATWGAMAPGENPDWADSAYPGEIANWVFSAMKQTDSQGKRVDLLIDIAEAPGPNLWYKNANLKLPKKANGTRPKYLASETHFLVRFLEKNNGNKPIWICWDPRIVVELDDSP